MTLPKYSPKEILRDWREMLIRMDGFDYIKILGGVSVDMPSGTMHGKCVLIKQITQGML